jgi:hypothetical protein
MSLKSDNTLFTILLLILLLTMMDPVLANKFSTIGGGVSGSSEIKIEFLKIAAYVVAAVFILFGILSVVQRNQNAQTLNYTMWKSSATIFIVLGIGSAVLGFLL